MYKCVGIVFFERRINNALFTLFFTEENWKVLCMDNLVRDSQITCFISICTEYSFEEINIGGSEHTISVKDYLSCQRINDAN
jgi:hypothetical protein